MCPVFISCGHSRGSNDINEHRHSGTELVFLAEGRCVHKVNGCEYPASPGSVMFIPSQAFHCELRQGTVETRYLIFQDEKDIHPQNPRLIDTDGDPLTAHWMRDMLLLQNEYEQEQRNALLAALLHRLKRIKGKTMAAKQRHPALNQAVRLLEQSISKPRSLEQTARQCGVSISYLNALFNTEFGFGPSRFLLQLRMARARQLLKDPYLTVAEIGPECGFDKSYYFCRMFKKVHGCSPGEYRCSRN